MSGTPGPLAGITVVALEQAVSAPLCTRTLGDLGARVIKVENPVGGDFTRHFDDVVNGPGGLAAHFVWVNRGKESLALDVKSDEGREVLHRLLATADVLVSNLAPGATTRLGISPAHLADTCPDLIALEIDGYGPGGPLSHKRAYDLLVQAESGSCAITGTEGAPAKPGAPVADVCTGLYAAITLLALLRERAAGIRRGSGAVAAAVSMFDTMTDVLGYALTVAQHTGVDQVPIGMASPAVAPYGSYPTADGHTVVLGTTNDPEWRRLARGVLGRPDLADDDRYRTTPQRVAARAEIDAVIAEWVGRHDLAVVQKAADDAGIGNSRYNTPTEVVAHPHLVARDRWREVPSPRGPITVLQPPSAIAGWEPRMGTVPALGEHTDAVLAEFGFDAEALRRQDAV